MLYTVCHECGGMQRLQEAWDQRKPRAFTPAWHFELKKEVRHEIGTPDAPLQRNTGMRLLS